MRRMVGVCLGSAAVLLLTASVRRRRPRADGGQRQHSGGPGRSFPRLLGLSRLGQPLRRLRPLPARSRGRRQKARRQKEGRSSSASGTGREGPPDRSTFPGFGPGRFGPGGPGGFGFGPGGRQPAPKDAPKEKVKPDERRGPSADERRGPGGPPGRYGFGPGGPPGRDWRDGPQSRGTEKQPSRAKGPAARLATAGSLVELARAARRRAAGASQLGSAAFLGSVAAWPWSATWLRWPWRARRSTAWFRRRSRRFRLRRWSRWSRRLPARFQWLGWSAAQFRRPQLRFVRFAAAAGQ